MKKITFLADAGNAHMQRWLTALSKDFEIQVVTQSLDTNVPKNVQQIHYNIQFSRNPLLRPLQILRQNRKIRKAIAAFSPDILHVHYALAHSIAYALPKNITTVVSLWGSDIVPLPGKNFSDQDFAYLDLYLSRATRITVTSSFLATYFTKLFRDTYQKPTVIPFGIDTGLYAPMRRTKNVGKPVVVGFARQFYSHYGFMDLLQASAPLCKENLLTLRVAGSGEEENLYKAAVAKLGLQHAVKFVGRIENAFEMPKFYASIDIFANPSHRESFGVAALEAESCEVPVVAAKTGGIPETVKNGETGILYQVGDIEELRAALKKLAEDSKLRESMGRAGRKFVQETYEWQKNVEAMKQVYEDVTK